MAQLDHKDFSNPDEVMTPPKTQVDVVKLGGTTVARQTFEPGWKWSECVGPSAGTPLCEMHHTGYIAQGVLAVKMKDGTEAELRAGEAAVIPPGHDAWVVGDEPVVFVDFHGVA